MKKIEQTGRDKSVDENKGEVLIYQSEDGLTNVEVTVRDETVWLDRKSVV